MNSNRFSVKNNHVTAVFHISISLLTIMQFNVIILVVIMKGKILRPWEKNKRYRIAVIIIEQEAMILDEWAQEYNVPQHHQAYPDSGEHFPGGNYMDHTHIYNVHVPYISP